MTQATKWDTILDLLSKNQELSLKLLLAIHQITEPKATPSLQQPDSMPMPKLESKEKARTKQQVQPTFLDDLKQDLKEAKDTLQSIEASLSSASQPQWQKVKKRNPKPKQSQRQCVTLKQKPQFNPEKEVVIAGLTYVPEEDLRWKVKLIAQSKGMEVSNGHIVRCFRALNKDSKTKKKTQSCPLVVVEWATNQMKQDFKRHRPLPGGGETEVFINENLNPTQKSLFFEARVLRKKFPDLISHVWTRDGECFVRCIEGGRKIKIKSKKDIQTLQKKIKKKTKKTVVPPHMNAPTKNTKVATPDDGGSTYPKS